MVLLRHEGKQGSDRTAKLLNLEKGENMKDELIARDARGRALEASGYKVLTDQDRIDISQDLKQLYFHAGRWVGGARDYTAREAYHAYNRREAGDNGKVRLK